MIQSFPEKISQADAHGIIVGWLRGKTRTAGPDYGYDLYLPSAISQALGNPQYGELERFQRQNMRAFTDAAWNLCRRGILRPGVRDFGGQGNPNGYGYSLTASGEAWLAGSADDEFVGMEPGQMAERLATFGERFGAGYLQRVQEEAQSYTGTAYLGCCAMSGAAAESILLAAASAKIDPAHALHLYRSARGRSKIENLVFGRAPEAQRRAAVPGLSLLNYWRDDASHGTFSPISEPDAFLAQSSLLRLAALVDDHWSELTLSDSPDPGLPSTA